MVLGNTRAAPAAANTGQESWEHSTATWDGFVWASSSPKAKQLYLNFDVHKWISPIPGQSCVSQLSAILAVVSCPIASPRGCRGYHPVDQQSEPVLSNSLLFTFPVKHFLTAAHSFIPPCTTDRFRLWDLNLDLRQTPLGVLRPHLWGVPRCPTWPASVAGQGMCPPRGFISLISRVTDHHLVPFKQPRALNCTSCIQTPSNLLEPGQVRW